MRHLLGLASTPRVRHQLVGDAQAGDFDLAGKAQEDAAFHLDQLDAGRGQAQFALEQGVVAFARGVGLVGIVDAHGSTLFRCYHYIADAVSASSASVRLRGVKARQINP